MKAVEIQRRKMEENIEIFECLSNGIDDDNLEVESYARLNL